MIGRPNKLTIIVIFHEINTTTIRLCIVLTTVYIIYTSTIPNNAQMTSLWSTEYNSMIKLCGQDSR